MSIREDIAANLVTTLSKIVTPTSIKYVTREPFEFDRLSNAQYPAILVRSADEVREDATMTTRSGTINYELVCFVKGKRLDEARNNIIESVEEGLEVDRTLGNKAVDTQVVSVEVDEGSIAPIGGVIITVRVLYYYTRGIT